MTTMKTDWKEYRKRVEALEAEGLATGDAQAAVDAEMMQEDKAHSRLTTSAPELLDALRVIHANAGESPEWIRTRIDAVIAKVEGREKP